MKYSRIELSTNERDVPGWGEGLGAEAIIGQLKTKLGTEINV